MVKSTANPANLASEVVSSRVGYAKSRDRDKEARRNFSRKDACKHLFVIAFYLAPVASGALSEVSNVHGPVTKPQLRLFCKSCSPQQRVLRLAQVVRRVGKAGRFEMYGSMV